MTAQINDNQVSDVYFSSRKLKEGENLVSKLTNLCSKANIGGIDFNHKFTAIKMHFGEAGNLAYLRPNYAKIVVDFVKGLGGYPFLTDCNTLYPGRRKNALEHLDLAFEHGFSPFSTGCQIIIADGLSGTDELLVPVNNGKYIKEAKIGRAIMDADVIISLNHFKCHVETGIGGALKNIGMGCGSRAGKMEMHAATGPKINPEKCTCCRKCARFCASNAIRYDNQKAEIDTEKCIECGHCIGACPEDAIYASYDEASERLDAKIVEYAKAVLDGRPSFHVSLAIDISPLCDCWPANDTPVVQDIGFFASTDPVALDMACAEAVNSQPVNSQSVLAQALGMSESRYDERDYFAAVNPHSQWQATLAYAEELGLGSCKYRLIEV